MEDTDVAFTTAFRKTHMSVKYVETELGDYQLFRRPVKRKGPMQLAPGQGQDGYGNRIHTDYVLQVTGECRKYRVYCVCFSNSGSNYIERNGEKLFLRTTWFHSEIPDEPK